MVDCNPNPLVSMSCTTANLASPEPSRYDGPRPNPMGGASPSSSCVNPTVTSHPGQPPAPPPYPPDPTSSEPSAAGHSTASHVPRSSILGLHPLGHTPLDPPPPLDPRPPLDHTPLDPRPLDPRDPSPLGPHPHDPHGGADERSPSPLINHTHTHHMSSMSMSPNHVPHDPRTHASRPAWDASLTQSLAPAYRGSPSTLVNICEPDNNDTKTNPASRNAPPGGGDCVGAAPDVNRASNGRAFSSAGADKNQELLVTSSALPGGATGNNPARLAAAPTSDGPGGCL